MKSRLSWVFFSLCCVSQRRVPDVQLKGVIVTRVTAQITEGTKELQPLILSLPAVGTREFLTMWGGTVPGDCRPWAPA